MRILVAEDDQVLADGLLRSLRSTVTRSIGSAAAPKPMPRWPRTSSIW